MYGLCCEIPFCTDDLCDVVIPSEPCPRGTDPERALFELEESLGVDLGVDELFRADMRRADESAKTVLLDWFQKGWTLSEVAEALDATPDGVADLLATKWIPRESILRVNNLVTTGEAKTLHDLTKLIPETPRRALRQVVEMLNLKLRDAKCKWTDDQIEDVLHQRRILGLTFQQIEANTGIPWHSVRKIVERAA